MNNQELWQRYQDWLYFHEGLGLYLDVSRMNFGDDLIGKLQPKFEQAFKAMDELEAGAIANPDENRRVGHYWLRDPELAPEELKGEIVATLEQIESFVEKVHEGIIRPPSAPQFTDILSIGIGGSSLGPKFVAKALVADFPPLNIHFIDNTDPDGMDQVLNRLKDRLCSTLCIVISKSGGTSETRNGLLEAKHAFHSQGLDFSRHAVAITMSGSQMDVAENCDNWLAKFAMFDWVGGRTSEMSSVGLLSAALLGIDIRSMLGGAQEMDKATRLPDIKRNPASLLALCWYHACHGDNGSKNMVILPYKDSLVLFSRYLQQLVMESLGKELDRDGKVVHEGITVYGNKGSTDQHAYVQQLREGLPDFFATFIEVLEDRKGPSIEIEPDFTSGDFLSGLLQGTRQALYDNQRESITITVPRVDTRCVGALIALYERAVGFYASLVNINAYHQPGVEAGKKAAADFLLLQKNILAVLKTTRQPLTLSALAEKIGVPDQVETIYKVVRHLSMNPRQIVLHGNLAKPVELSVSLGRQNNEEGNLILRKAS
ncbi:glucose-6-phosphate isomerase Pgi [Methyloglobulus morosus KoM1]|uniref:Glucose-6-phosphate isomerase n=1 Tax=Methyloglobulus morosus KoM1 TaxID=1116472 RepID=V5CA90_9GAMM|nr:glucose-6-phosphate isomerase [Methyloglobulus morosus]ESS73728.1 glucose-6-phosphate isomerase Pgi [Methyloglobulus morosus KoM1]